MLKRKQEKDILRWIETSNKALLVYGVRQAGKTFLIKECLKKAKCDFVEFNLINQPNVLDALQKSTSIDDLILRLTLVSTKKLIPHKTFIFFDEIQRFKELVTKIKFLVEDGRFRYVLSGSLLGVELRNLNSAPVGYVQTMMMYPLDFEEFSQSFNVDNNVMAHLKNCYLTRQPVDDMVHYKLLELFNLYLLIGGMPSAIMKYRQTQDINDVLTEHRSILNLYKADFTQYESENKKFLLTTIFDLIPTELNDKNRRFSVTSIKKSLRFERVEESFVWLWKAGVALPTFNVTEPVLPLKLNEKSSLFKLFLSDVGLLTTIYGKPTKLKILNNESDINRGAIYENVIAQELTAHGFPLYYYNSHKFGELDFVIEHHGKSLPIEVKSGKSYERHSALNNVLSVENYNLEEGVVLGDCNIKHIGKILYLPVYMVMFLSNDDIDFGDISIKRFSF